jgi:type II secretory pathway pseudopilin PulG
MKVANQQRGYTMLETIMYIGLLIVLGSTLASYAHAVMLRYKTGRSAQQVLELKKAIIQFTAADEDYSNVSVLAMDKSASLPLDMRTGNKAVARNALGGTVLVGPAAKLKENDNQEPNNSGDDDDEEEPATLSDAEKSQYYMFYIKFNGLPQGSCVEILTQGQFYGDGSEMDTLIVNNMAWQYKYSFFDFNQSDINVGTTKKLYPTGEGAEAAPSIRLNITEAMEACSNKDNNRIIWIFS